MSFKEVQASHEALSSLPLIRNIINKECKLRSPLQPNNNKLVKRKLIAATILCFLFFLAEIIGGILANSLAILTDSAHLLSDLSSFLISLVAICLSNRLSSTSMTFGWYRAEILGALVSVVMIWLVTGILIYTAILRVIYQDYAINATIMLIMSGIGVIMNVILAFVLHPHSHSHEHNYKHDVENNINESDEQLLHNDVDKENGIQRSSTFKGIENINLRAAFIHVIGDVVQSFGVLAAAFMIYFKPHWKIADPICTFVFSFIVILTTVFLFRDIIFVLFERKPRHINFSKVEKYLFAISGVLQVHNLRLWSITLTRTAITCHLIIDSHFDFQTILEEAYEICINKFGFSEITIQVESSKIDLSLKCDQ